MAGKHRPPRPCWRMRVTRVVAFMAHYTHEVSAVVTLHIVGIAAYESSIKHAVGSIIHIGH